MASSKFAIFGGNANPALTEAVCGYLGITQGKATVKTFADGESFVEIGQNVRGVDCFILQPTCTHHGGRNVNDHLMELLVMIDAFKRASAGSIVALMPYFGYARQDRKAKPRTPISAKLVADLLTAAGADRVLAVDLHAGQIQGFFNIPFDHLYATPVFTKVLKEEGLFGPEVVVVSPDAGGTERARIYSKALGCSLAIIDKRRDGPGVSQVMHLIGDVSGKRAIILDDMIDTAGTLCSAAAAVMEHGATEVHAVATHAVFSGLALTRIENSRLKHVWVTDSIPYSTNVVDSHGPHGYAEKVRTVSLAQLISEAVKRIHQEDSLSDLFL